ncbi:FxsA family protein [Telmatospirillum sp. J64-1]|uniref:FxsA family protein n=1 Tax=Telmatospirillum sp. J64-1 TaxID=2502183 RepID=UPI00115D0243|nr:FxsA family protein [Telmatospirillum sp. J64-1]
MPWIILAVIIAVPVLEIAFFIRIAEEIGILTAVVAVIGAGLAGLVVLRYQGFATIGRLRASLERGETPVAPMFDGLCLVIAGAFLLLPGFLTDIVGLLLLLPPVRGVLRGWAGRHLSVVATMTGARPHPSGRQPPGGPVVIDADYTEVRPQDSERRDAQDRLPPGKDGDERDK